MAEDPLEVGRHHERCCRLIDAQAVESRSGLEVRGHEELATGVASNPSNTKFGR